MRRAAPAIVAVLAVPMAACGEADQGTSAPPSQKPAAGRSGDKPALKLGEEATLKGLKDEKMKVRVLKIEDPMKSPPTERPKPGRHFVGVRIRLINLGKETYKDSPLNGARLVTTVKKASNPTILLSGKCPSKFGTGMRLAPGKTRAGCLPFQVKRGAKVTAFQFRLDSGYGPEMGEWSAP